MEIGISTASFFSKELTENALGVIKELGFNVSEVFLTTFYEYKKKFAKQLSHRKKRLDIYSLHTLNVQFEPELFNLTERTRLDGEKIFKQIAVSAKLLNAKYYTFHGLTRLKRTPYNIDFNRIGKRLDELDQMLYVESKGCQLAYENVHWTLFNSPEFFLELKKYSNVHTCLDIKQAMQSGHSVYDYIDAMNGRLANVHICDYDENGKLYMPGKGTFDFVKLFRRLQDIGYQGPVIMELYAGNYDNYEEIKQGYEFLLECRDKI